MRKVLVVLGTRPEAIKLAPVIHELRNDSQNFKTFVCATGQHRELLQMALAAFTCSVDWNLQVMRDDQTLGGLTSRLVETLDGVFSEVQPDLVLVQGDTTTAFAAALVGHYWRTEIGHVEAGLRTYDKWRPFPEETNRRLLGVLADHHFAPTERAKAALLREGIAEQHILVTGNTAIDALIMALKLMRAGPPSLGSIDALIDAGCRIVLITGHRRESFGAGFQGICKGIRALATAFPDVAFVYPVHLNPHVIGPVRQLLGEQANIHLLQPLGYLQFVRLMDASHLILTDSGGIQEEAPSLGKPVLVMRESTERPEAIEAGTARLVGTSEQDIFREGSRLLSDDTVYAQFSRRENPYGDGTAAARIVNYLREH